MILDPGPLVSELILLLVAVCQRRLNAYLQRRHIQSILTRQRDQWRAAVRSIYAVKRMVSRLWRLAVFHRIRWEFNPKLCWTDAMLESFAPANERTPFVQLLMTFSWRRPSRYSYQISLMNWQGHRVCICIRIQHVCTTTDLQLNRSVCVHVLACLEVHVCKYCVQKHVVIYMCVSAPRSQCSDEVYCSHFL